MTEEERQIIRNELPKWTEEFVQREWYREFLQHFPLSEYPSLLDVYPTIAKNIYDYCVKYEIDKLELFDNFMGEIR